MKNYDKYKESGVEWIGEIPAHWKITRFAFHFLLSRGLPITKQDLKDKGIPCVNYGEIHSKYGFEVIPEVHSLKYVEEEYLSTSDKSLLSRGDFVFADTSEDVEGAGNFTCLHSDKPTFAGYHTIIARQKTNDNYRFLAYYFDSIEYRNQIRSSVSGIKVLSVTQGILKKTTIILPTIPEQTAIANYLDHKTAQIDDLISKKQRLIELLQEERTAIINQAVTKGLDPNVPMKNSGIEWLGEIPEHWEVKKMKYVTYLKSGESIISEQISESGSYPVYGGNGLRGYFSEFTHDGNYVLIGRQGALCGNIKYAESKFWASEHAIVSYLFNGHNWLWFGKLLEAMNLNQYSQSAAQPGLAVNEIKNLSIPVPSLDEQNRIVEFIRTESLGIGSLIDNMSSEIDLLKEYKTALISEVVTGKVDVRDEVIVN